MKNISPDGLITVKHIQAIHAEIKNKQPHVFYSPGITAEIQLYQPFILSFFTYYKADFKHQELEPLVNLYVLMWEMYKDEANVRSIPITSDHFMKSEEEIVHMLYKMKTTRFKKDREELIRKSLHTPLSKAIIMMMLEEFRVNPELEKINKSSKGGILSGIRSFIQCFDDIITGSWPA